MTSTTKSNTIRTKNVNNNTVNKNSLTKNNSPIKNIINTTKRENHKNALLQFFSVANIFRVN